MKEIRLLNSALVALIDDEDYSLVKVYNWSLFNNHGSGINGLYAKTAINGINLYMHQFIMPIEDPKITIDHKDGNGLNNQKSNFRPATKSQQAYNRKKRTVGSSMYKGVSFKKQTKRWIARIMLDGKAKSLGGYESEKEAAMAYDLAAKTYFKEFASLNFADKVPY